VLVGGFLDVALLRQAFEPLDQAVADHLERLLRAREPAFGQLGLAAVERFSGALKLALRLFELAALPLRRLEAGEAALERLQLLACLFGSAFGLAQVFGTRRGIGLVGLFLFVERLARLACLVGGAERLLAGGLEPFGLGAADVL